MHGSSSVPKELQDVINAYGGKLKPTWGVPVEEIQLASATACARSTSTRTTAWRSPGAIRKVFMEKPEEFDPRSYLKPAREAMKKVVAERMTQFGQAGHAGDYTPMTMAGDGGPVRQGRGREGLIDRALSGRWARRRPPAAPLNAANSRHSNGGHSSAAPPNGLPHTADVSNSRRARRSARRTDTGSRTPTNSPDPG